MSTEIGLVPYKLAPHRVDDPLHDTWPATLAMELAMKEQHPKDICEAYGIDGDRWLRLQQNEAFRAELKAAIEALRKEGASFRIRAQMQATELLKRSWHLIHSPDVPPAVQADLLKFTVKAAGFDASAAGVGNGKGGIAQSFNITLNLA